MHCKTWKGRKGWLHIHKEKTDTISQHPVGWGRKGDDTHSIEMDEITASVPTLKQSSKTRP